jgi:hypothetical protein
MGLSSFLGGTFASEKGIRLALPRSRECGSRGGLKWAVMQADGCGPKGKTSPKCLPLSFKSLCILGMYNVEAQPQGPKIPETRSSHELSLTGVWGSAAEWLSRFCKVNYLNSRGNAMAYYRINYTKGIHGKTVTITIDITSLTVYILRLNPSIVR